jgi:hypothetical protein
VVGDAPTTPLTEPPAPKLGATDAFVGATPPEPNDTAREIAAASEPLPGTAPGVTPPTAVGTAEAPAGGQELAVIAQNAALHANGNGNGNGHANGNGKPAAVAPLSLGGGPKVSFAVSADSPSCADCGSIMVRNGSCYKCLNCGATSGCS